MDGHCAAAHAGGVICTSSYENKMSVLEKITNNGQSIWRQGKPIWFFASITLGAILIILALISLLGLIEASAIKSLLGAAVSFGIAYIFKNGKTKDI